MKDIDPQKVEKLAAGGANITQLAAALRISRETWYKRVKVEPELQDAFDRGQGMGCVAAQDQLKKNIEDGNQRAVEYFLNNRDAANWSSRQRHELSGPDGGPIQGDLVIKSVFVSPDDSAAND